MSSTVELGVYTTVCNLLGKRQVTGEGGHPSSGSESRRERQRQRKGERTREKETYFRNLCNSILWTSKSKICRIAREAENPVKSWCCTLTPKQSESRVPSSSGNFSLSSLEIFHQLDELQLVRRLIYFIKSPLIWMLISTKIHLHNNI